MAQLKDSLITGDLRVTGATYTNELDAQKIMVPTTSGGSIIGAGSSGQVVMSNGTSSYWGNVPAGTAVKGNAESTYRTGNVNLTPANLGISATTSSVTVGDTTFNKYTHPSGDGNLHVPATSTTHYNYFLKAGSTAGSLSWAQPIKYGSALPASGDFVGQVFILIDYAQ